MIDFKIKNLSINCKLDTINIDFSHQISFFHGPVSVGKSTIVKLIDFSLGGTLDDTPVIQSELVAVTLQVTINNIIYHFSRNADQHSSVSISWLGKDHEEKLLLPLIGHSGAPLFEEDVWSFSDFILTRMGIKPFKVPMGQSGKSANFSFRDIFWYCYLNQEELETSFLHLNDYPELLKSRYVIRYVLGNYNEELNDLNIKLIKIRSDLSNKNIAIENINNFLNQFGFISIENINSEIKELFTKCENINEIIVENKDTFLKETSFVDKMRQEVLEIENELAKKIAGINDLNLRIQEHTSYKFELLNKKAKLESLQSAVNILSGSSFSICPECGTQLDKLSRDKEVCILCGSSKKSSIKIQLDKNIILNDIDNRISEIEEIITYRQFELNKLKTDIKNMEEKKNSINIEINNVLEKYSSQYLSNNIILEREMATYKERIKQLNNLQQIPNSMNKLSDERDDLNMSEMKIKETIFNEESKIKDSEKYIREIEQEYKGILLNIKLPNINENDVIKINKNTWIPAIYINGDPKKEWSFNNAGSLGVKTLLNVCYALSIHIVSVKNKLPLPNILIIDTPSKNISEIINIELYESFYKYLYLTAKTTLSNTQFIIIDRQFVKPGFELDMYERYMTSDNPNYPPLIPYYKVHNEEKS